MLTYSLHLTLKDLKKKFTTDFPQICYVAMNSISASEFKQKISELFPYDTIKRLAGYDGKTIIDFSTCDEVNIQTFSSLYHFLRDEENAAKTDLLTDLYFIFRNTQDDTGKEAAINLNTSHNIPLPEKDGVFTFPQNPVPETKVIQWSKRWVSGLNPGVQQVREANKQRIISKLIQRLGRRYSVNTQYYLPQFRSYEEKYRAVNEWWNSHRFHLHMAIKNPDELNSYLGKTLPEETMQVLHDAKKKGIPFFITPYYASLLDITGKNYDDNALRSYILYSKELVETFGEIKAWEKEDEVEADKANAAGWVLPEGNNIHRRYPEVAILIPDSMGRACGGLCASCQRMYDFQSKRLNFNFKELLPKESWPIKLKKLMRYFEEDTQLRDILITGGDALMSRNATLRNIFDAIYKMALLKKKANENLPDGEKYAEIQRIRLGTRLPVYLPMRIDDELISILKEFKEKASKIGITQLIVQTHFQTPLEMTKEAKESIKRIISAGWIVTNQLVYNVAASRRGHTVSLRKTLISNGVVPYYTFSVKGFNENYAVYAPIARSMQEKAEEKVYGVLNENEQEAFIHILENNTPYTKEINNFLQKNNYPFAATDRSVLNLPGIGKSMTFHLAGITNDGKRVLCFDHDTTRKHSPAIKEFGKIYITENKSILAYLKQLEQLGEDVKAYKSIWRYTEGVTEPKFKLYEYPKFPFTVTKEITHMG